MRPQQAPDRAGVAFPKNGAVTGAPTTGVEIISPLPRTELLRIGHSLATAPEWMRKAVHAFCGKFNLDEQLVNAVKMDEDLQGYPRERPRVQDMGRRVSVAWVQGREMQCAASAPGTHRVL